jgi:hypothetical protein
MSIHEAFPYSPPFLADGTPVIVFDRARALPAKWDATVAGFCYPVNQLELAEEALAILLASFPEAAQENRGLRVFTCPRALFVRCDFNVLHLPVDGTN